MSAGISTVPHRESFMVSHNSSRTWVWFHLYVAQNKTQYSKMDSITLLVLYDHFSSVRSFIILILSFNTKVTPINIVKCHNFMGMVSRASSMSPIKVSNDKLNVN